MIEYSKKAVFKETPVLYIVIPCYNEEKVLPVTLPLFLQKLMAFVKTGEVSDESKILLVDNDSSDSTWSIIKDFNKNDSHFAGIRQNKNRGHQSNLLAGLMTALNCGAVIDGKCVPTAFNHKTIDSFYSKEDGDEIKSRIKQKFGERESATVVELLECDDELIRGYAQFLFEKDYSLYTAKQWNVKPSEIDPSVLKRVPIRFNYDEAYFKDKHQVMPAEDFSYVEFFKNLLGHPNIEVKLNTEALEHLSIDEGNILLFDGKIVDYPVIYTGPLDELFGCKFGRLPYRSLRFEWKHEEKDSFQEMPVVAYPQAEGFTRITEYKKLPVQNVAGTTYAVEYPLAYKPEGNTEPYYPVLTKESQVQYAKYAKLLTGGGVWIICIYVVALRILDITIWIKRFCERLK